MLSASGIFSDLDVEVELDAPIGAMTWYGIGGRADVLLRPRSVDALATLVRRCRRSRTPLRVLGRGANLLVADEGVDGVVVRLDAPPFNDVSFVHDSGAVILKAGAGADMARTLMDATRRGYAGLAHMAGIPASIGGAVRMNAGGKYGSISDTVSSVLCLSRTGDIVPLDRAAINFEYRNSNITEPIILEASFRLHEDDPVALRERVKEIFTYKKSTQPLAEHSAGCAFKNAFDPEHETIVSAGKLIDEAGLKGTRLGGASVSHHHANFITVEGGARADEVLRLMEIVRERVFQHAGMALENEVIIWRRGDGGAL